MLIFKCWPSIENSISVQGERLIHVHEIFINVLSLIHGGDLYTEFYSNPVSVHTTIHLQIEAQDKIQYIDTSECRITYDEEDARNIDVEAETVNLTSNQLYVK